jgi:hypothetical protein
MAFATAGCALVRYPVPNWAARDNTNETWMFHDKGSVFEKDFYESVVDGTYRESGQARQVGDDVAATAVSLVADLRHLDASGATYWIGPDNSGKLVVQIGRPGGDLGDALKGTALDQLGVGDARHAQFIEASLARLAMGTNQLSRHRAHIEWRMYGAVQDIAKLRRHEDIPLGDGVTAAEHEQMLHVLLVALDRDRAYFRSYEAGGLALAAELRSATSANARSTANVEATLLAMRLDARRADAQRKAFEGYPPPAEARAEASTDFERLLAEIEHAPGYAEWRNGSHAGRELTDFRESAQDALRAFSALTGAVMGVDFYAKFESFTKQFDPVAFALRVAERAPWGSALRDLFEKAKRLSKAYEQVRAADADAAKKAVLGRALVLVEDEAHVKSVEDELRKLGVPTSPHLQP